VLEDSAHAIGSQLEGRSLGTWGSIGCYSFFSNKNMTTGEGGMLVTEDPAIAERLRLLRSHGMTTLSWDRHQGHAHDYDVVDLGYNYRIDEMRSAIGRVQLRKLASGNERRRRLTLRYRELLAELAPDVRMPFAEARGTSCYHILPVLLPVGVDRPAFQGAMKTQGIQTSNHYPPVHQFMIYREEEARRASRLPLTEEVGRRQVTLPLFPTMTDDQVHWVVQAVRESLELVSA
jgi:dTDP-4-amino-4,6-dideoxygalactose transaminase